jgi:hypothetical protein
MYRQLSGTASTLKVSVRGPKIKSNLILPTPKKMGGKGNFPKWKKCNFANQQD